jgi:hypothetical protein
MIKLLGELKGIVVKSKVSDDNEEVHIINLNIKLMAGQDRIQELLGHLRKIVEVDIDSKQPALGMGAMKED